ncbi:MAG: hypothetical protein RLZZ165_2187 [Bacteroidota bacterium]
MKTIAFYSYKGGVGRTLAVAHMAYWLGKQGKSVFLLDMDMEAPGLHYKIDKYTQPVSPEKGLVDYIGDYLLEKRPATSLDPYVIPLTPRDVDMPPLWFMPAGNPSDSSYWSQLSQVNWKEFLYGEAKMGSLLFLELKSQIQQQYDPDFLLIDSRTGLTDLTGIGLELLADDAVVLGVNNRENLEGSRLVMERLRKREKPPFKENKTRLHFVLTRIPAPTDDSGIKTEEDLKKKVLETLNAGSGIASGPLVTRVNVIHIDPDQALEERIRFLEEDWDQYPILKDYQDLVAEVTGVGSTSGSFGELHNQWRLEKESGRKQELARKLVTMETSVPEQERARGIIAYWEIKDFPAAILAYTHAIDLRPDYAEAYCNRSLAHHGLQQYDLAVDDSTKAIQLKPDFAEAFYNRGSIYQNLKRYDLALEDFTKAILLKPDFAVAYCNRGIAYYSLQQYGLALDDLTKTIELKPDFAEAYCILGIALHKLHQYDLALEEFNKAIGFKKDYDLAYISRALTYFELGEHNEAMQDAQKVLEINPQDAQAYVILAQIHSLQGNTDAFYANLQKAMELNPSQIHQLDAATRARHENEDRFQTLLKNAPPKDSDKKEDKTSPPSPLGS